MRAGAHSACHNRSIMVLREGRCALKALRNSGQGVHSCARPAIFADAANASKEGTHMVKKSFQSLTSDSVIVRGAIVDELAAPPTVEEVAVDANVEEGSDMVSMVLC